MSQLNKKFVSYLKQNYKDTIENVIYDYIYGEEVKYYFLAEKIGDQYDLLHLQTLEYLNIDFDLINVFFEDTNNSSLLFSAVVRCFYSFKIYSHDEGIYFRDDNVERWLKIFFTSKLGAKLRNLNAYCVENYSKSTYLLKQDTGKMVPYIFEEDLDRIAEDFIIRNYPEALTEPMALPIEDIAEGIGLEITYVEMLGDIFGQLFFEDLGYAIQHEICRGTLWLNLRYVIERSEEAKRFTIAHECIHWDRHRKYMDLNRLLNKDEFSIIECPTSSKGWSQLQKTFRDMEWQANNLAARILMPEKTTRQKFEELFSNRRNRFPNERNGLSMAATIRELADFYQVSLMTAKYRAVQLGFEQAAGVFNYVDGQIVKPIWFKDGALSKYQAFVVDRSIAEKEMAENKELNFLVKSGRVVYLNGMFIINHPRYVRVNTQGGLKPTKYALEHADECCFVLTIQQTWTQEYGDVFSELYFLNRSVNREKNKQAILSLDESHNSYLVQILNKPEMVQCEINEMIELIEHGLCSAVSSDGTDNNRLVEGSLPATFHQTLKWHINRAILKKNNGIDDLLDVATVCLLDESSIENHLKQKNAPLLPTIMAYCIGLHLEPFFALDLIDKAGFSILAPTFENAVYLYLIFYYRYESIDSCNWIIYEINKLDHTGGKRKVRYIPNDKKGNPQNDEKQSVTIS